MGFKSAIWPLFRRAIVGLAALVALAFADASRLIGDVDASGAIYPVFTDYRQIPGVDQKDIDDIEAIKAKRTEFILANALSTELFLDSQGRIGGYIPLFLEFFNQLFGIDVKPKIASWDELLAGLATKEYSFTGELTADAERRKTYFMTGSIAERSVRYLALVGVDLDDIALERPLKLAFLTESITKNQVIAAASLPFDSIDVENYHQAYQALKEGRADALMADGPAEAAFDAFGDIQDHDFFPFIYSPVSLATQDPELAPFVRVFQKALDAGISPYLAELYNQGERDYQRRKFLGQLNSEELAYLEKRAISGDPILISGESDNYPISFFNHQENEYQGLAFDILAEISVLTGLTFKMDNAKDATWSQIFADLEKGRQAMTVELIASPERANRFLLADKPYMVDNFALLSKREMEDIRLNEILFLKVGLVKDTAYANLFRRWFPDHKNVIEYQTNLEGFAALENGEIDLLMATRNLLLAMTNYMEKPGFKANHVFNYRSNSTFGFNSKERLLFSVVNKALHSIDCASLAKNWTSRTFDYRSKMARAKIPWLVGFVLALIALLAVTARLMVRRGATNLELERLVLDRTRELERQKTAAIDASRAKGDFLARMSHEIRTPMNAIIGMTELTLREKLPDETYDMIQNIRQASNSLLAIINDILDFSKIESGHMELSEERYDFGGLLNDVIEVIRPRLANRPINFYVEVDSRIPGFLVGDEVRLRQILLNLLSNAAKYTREGHVALTVKAEASEGYAHLAFSVSDTGIGLRKKDLKNLFEDFNRFDASANKGVEGTGLGLAITLKLAQLMGGDVTVESEYLKGSTFTARIVQKIDDFKPLASLNDKPREILVLESQPRRAQSLAVALDSLSAQYALVADMSDLTEKLKRPEYNFLVAPDSRREDILKLLADLSRPMGLIFLTETPYHGPKSEAYARLSWPVFCAPLAKALNGSEIASRKSGPNNSFTAPEARILVVDDIELNLKVAKGLLKPFKAQVDTCENGFKAIDLVESKRYDLIFMDHMMPGLDGLETTQRIRSRPSGRDVPIIALTANAVAGVREIFIQNGMNDFISKPIDPSRLEQTLSQWLPREKLKSLS